MPSLGEKIIEPLCRQKAQNLTHSLFDNFYKKLSKNFLVKIVRKDSCVKIDTFSRLNGFFIFPLKEGIQKRKCSSMEVNLNIIYILQTKEKKTL